MTESGCTNNEAGQGPGTGGPSPGFFGKRASERVPDGPSSEMKCRKSEFAQAIKPRRSMDSKARNTKDEKKQGGTVEVTPGGRTRAQVEPIA